MPEQARNDAGLDAVDEMVAPLVELLRGLPDWIAWRLEAWVVVAKDRELSQPVLDAFWWRRPPPLTLLRGGAE
jgi:hypothetical protein